MRAWPFDLLKNLLGSRSTCGNRLVRAWLFDLYKKLAWFSFGVREQAVRAWPFDLKKKTCLVLVRSAATGW